MADRGAGEELTSPEAGSSDEADRREVAAAPPGDHPLWRRVVWAKHQFQQPPTFWALFLPALLVAVLLYARSPYTNCIFDEQEALLANPYVNDTQIGWGWEGFKRAFQLDFWGLPHTRSIGSYRPLPNLVWRALWQVRQHPWLPHWMNLMLHGTNAALLGAFAYRLTRVRMHGWLTAGVFLCGAVLTEAISGVVGIADIMGGMGIILALWALRLPILLMPLGVFAGALFGLFSKESAIVGVPLLLWAALVLAPLLHPKRPWRIPRALLALLAQVGGLILYVEVRRANFPVALPPKYAQPLPETEPLARRAMHGFMRWFAQPKLPQDPINNPLINEETTQRVYGALNVYAKGFVQTVVPWRLSGDYSFPQEVAPEHWYAPGVLIGGALMFLLPAIGVGLWIVGWRRELKHKREAAERAKAEAPLPEAPESKAPRAEQPTAGATTTLALPTLYITALAAVWVAVSYFPHSNVVVLLPTVRAERFWYVPMIGLAPWYALGITLLLHRARQWKRVPRWVPIAAVATLLGFQAQAARLHAIDYTNDLVFWRATSRTSSHSAKAHLNYSVMLGARGFMDARLKEGGEALQLAPQWPMAHIYYGDTLCRMHRADEAWPHYRKGFELGPNDLNLIALALQCLWDEKGVESRKDALLEISEKHKGTWLAYLTRDIVYYGEKHSGVDPKYRPRGYNQGPKKKSE